MIVLMTLFACDGGAAAGECVDNGECEQGFACVEETCVAADCLESASCAIGSYCNPDTYACEAGCGTDDDCYAGEACDVATFTCIAADCRNATLDCEIAQFCDETTGACYDDTSFAYCETTCDAASAMNTCGIDALCGVSTLGEECSRDSDCEPGWKCDNFGAGVGNLCHLDYCMNVCDLADENACPAGFDCSAYDNTNGVCAADCNYLTENGYL